LAITKTDGVASVNAGGSTTYTVVATNGGPSAVVGATVTDTAPSTMTFSAWSCVASVGSSCPASGSGNISASVNLLSGGTATFTVDATVAGNATGSIVNTATIAPPAGVTDPNLANNTATDTDALTSQVTLMVAKTDGSATYTPGGTATYTITVTNTGASDATNVTVSDALPAGLKLTAGVSCVANGGASCGSVTGAIGETSLGTTGASINAG